jgi:Kdo2-lipid IVA lauroyltransferase/acyltransferase
MTVGISKRIERFPLLRSAEWAVEACILGLFWWICAHLSPDGASRLGRRLLSSIGPRLRKSAYMMRNLTLAFPDLSNDERRKLLREVWGNTGAVLGEYPHLERLVQRDFEDNFDIVSQVDLNEYRAGGKQAIFVTAHFGNWELTAGVVSHFGIPLTVVYSPIRNAFVDRMLRCKRKGLGCQLVVRDGSLPYLMKVLGEGRSLGLIVDHRDDSGTLLPFFGLQKATTVVPARLALRQGCDLIPGRVERLADARFRVSVFQPIQPDPTITSVKHQAVQMMAEVNVMFEQWIRDRPQQWLCTKRAWPKDVTCNAAQSNIASAEPGTATPVRTST